jgi:hypothetical protein
VLVDGTSCFAEGPGAETRYILKSRDFKKVTVLELSSVATKLAFMVLASLPALSYLLLIFVLCRNDYFFAAHILMALAFLAISTIMAIRLPMQVRIKQNHQRTVSLIFTNITIAWIVSLIVLGLLNVTPLCIGQDNGDGHNGFGLCFLQTVLSAVACTPPMLVSIYLTSRIGGNILRRHIED